MHNVFSPVNIDRDIRFMGRRKGILLVFINFGIGKLEGYGLMFGWVGGMGGGDVILEVLSSEDGGRPGDVGGIEVINCAGDDVWWSRGSGGVESSLGVMPFLLDLLMKQTRTS